MKRRVESWKGQRGTALVRHLFTRSRSRERERERDDRDLGLSMQQKKINVVITATTIITLKGVVLHI